MVVVGVVVVVVVVVVCVCEKERERERGERWGGGGCEEYSIMTIKLFLLRFYTFLLIF